MSTLKLALACCFALCCLTSVLAAQEMPADYKQVLDAFGRQGDFKDGVLKVNIPRSDLNVAVDGVATPTPFGFGGWVALTKGTGGKDVMMGDLVLDERRSIPSCRRSRQRSRGDRDAQSFLFRSAAYLLHARARSRSRGDIAAKLKPALALIGKSPVAASAMRPARRWKGRLDTEALAKIIGTPGERTAQSTRSRLAVQTSKWSGNGRTDHCAYGAEYLGGVLRQRCRRGRGR